MCPAAACCNAKQAGQPSNPSRSTKTLLVSPSPVLSNALAILSTKLDPPRCSGASFNVESTKPKHFLKKKWKQHGNNWPFDTLKKQHILKTQSFKPCACLSSCTLVKRDSVPNFDWVTFSAFSISFLGLFGFKPTSESDKMKTQTKE